MLNKILLTVVSVLFVVGVSRMIIMPVDTQPWLAVAALVAVIMMMVNGTFMETIYYRVAIGAVGVFILGVVFKIMHLTGSDQMIIAACIFLVGAYVVHFLTKPSRKLSDVMKLVFVIALVVSRVVPYVLRLLHLHWVAWEDSLVLYLVAELILWAAFGYFVFDGMRRKTLFRN